MARKRGAHERLPVEVKIECVSRSPAASISNRSARERQLHLKKSMLRWKVSVRVAQPRMCVCVFRVGHVRITECNVTRFRASVNRIRTNACRDTFVASKGYCVGNYHLDLGQQ